MSYQYVEFDGVSLPLYDHAQSHDPMPVETAIVDSIGGAHDWWGSARRRGRKQLISFIGRYFAEGFYLVDDVGDFLVDEAGHFLTTNFGPEALRQQVDSLLEKRGVRGPLWRLRLDDNALEWKTARLLQIGWPRIWEDHALIAKLTPQFETLMDGWHAENATNTSGSATDGVPLGINVENTGQMAVYDAALTVTRTSGTITAVTIVYLAGGIDLEWTGSLGDGDVLTIDCSNQTVRKNSTDAYSGFSLESAHTAEGWLPLEVGVNALVVTVTGGDATVAVSHYNQSP